MQLLDIQNTFIVLMARFVTEIVRANAISRTEINHIAEVILVPMLAETYGYRHLRSLNVDEGENFPAIDLGDDEARIAIQVGRHGQSRRSSGHSRSSESTSSVSGTTGW